MFDGLWHVVCAGTAEGEVEDDDAVGDDKCGRTHDKD